MFPLSDENAGRKLTPFVSYSLIVLNVLVFIYQVTLSQSALVNFYFDWGVIPAEISQGREFFTLLSGMFLHGGWIHLGSNMLFLWVFGDNVEDVMGHVGFLIFYLGTGIVASLAQVFVNPDSMVPVVGASGAIAGVLAAYIVLFPRGLIRSVIFFWIIPFFILIPAWVQIGLWFVIQLVAGFASLGVATATTGGGIAYFAHIGGFVAGLILVAVFRDESAHARQKSARRQHRAWEREQSGR